jgi:pimeloyl-ACP methyl ester carboxylesterase
LTASQADSETLRTALAALRGEVPVGIWGFREYQLCTLVLADVRSNPGVRPRWRFDLNPELHKFNLPTLVITGRYDMNVAPLVAYKIHQVIAGDRSSPSSNAARASAAFLRSRHVMEQFLAE